MRPFVKPVVLVLFLLTTFALAPAVLAARPTRTVDEGPSDPFVIPAGFGCAFDVGFVGSDNAGGATIDFGDGRIATFGHGEPTFTNLETGAVYDDWTSQYRSLDTYDPVTNTSLFEVHGRFWAYFFPGDQGPFGLVGEPGAFFGTVGHVTLTVDAATGVFTSYSLNGQTTDICAELS